MGWYRPGWEDVMRLVGGWLEGAGEVYWRCDDWGHDIHGVFEVQETVSHYKLHGTTLKIFEWANARDLGLG